LNPLRDTGCGPAGFEAVIAAARSGDERAHTTLYREFQPGLLGYLRSQRPGDAEDIAAETWIAAARGLRRFRGDEDDFRRWIFTIARRRLIDEDRRQARRPPIATTESAPEAAAAGATAAEDEALERIETRRALERVAALPPDEAEVVILRVIAGLPANDVAKITGRTPGHIRVLQHRALQRLAELIGTTFVTIPAPLAM
jgi:RNA polymerase sigma-70 factor (ECF subfamily)